ncbi:helix-turn-helix DNA-binding protein [Gordonia phage Mcklovin]|uniref:Helix-turn-helix DNA binding protein n=2 Tax=Howevirus TaxID=3044733 RepID=A0A0U4AZ39_9CAUD|nr:helix-turn-helix DNA binding protein [Gordonia phage Howe]YP_010654983.1 helix-turn-helix DNA-binding protein [Gordonia phage Mcklovin]AZF93231.1 helix-turn-helix DNA binding protein [Gordonia phage Adora]QDF16826.1 helix-turn-helix DNA binding protein [Gordonia phage Twinkle]QYC54445.1 helix-turn-helix DNA binding domain protein [Gordonia phage Shlim410]UAJ16295.1 helix-turn-helix DNA binding domain protein [Gordonia phage Hortense]ALY07680.1 helix-turn-helix DNA binding protein [Gordonia
MRVKDGGQIRRWRKQRKYSQRELAYLVRRTQSTIYLIETGKLRTVTEDLGIAIAARLDVPWEDLFEAHEESVDPVVGHDSSSTHHAAGVA